VTNENHISLPNPNAETKTMCTTVHPNPTVETKTIWTAI